MKELKLNKMTMHYLELAMETNDYSVEWYLDLKTGDVHFFGPDDPSIDSRRDRCSAR